MVLARKTVSSLPVNEVKAKSSFQISNPFSNQIQITSSENFNKINGYLYDVSGREIQKWENVIINANETNNLTLQNAINTGLYFFKIQNESVNYTTKIMQSN